MAVVAEAEAAAGPALEELAAALAEWRPLGSLPECPERTGPPAPGPLRARLDRLERQIEVLHGAVTRGTTDEAFALSPAAPAWPGLAPPSTRAGGRPAPGEIGGQPPHDERPVVPGTSMLDRRER